jgi:hypothetical protein
MKTDNQEVRLAILQSIAEWGIERGWNEKHRNFHDNALKMAQNFCTRKDTNNRLRERFEELKPNHLPEDPIEAIRYVLLAELKEVDKNKLFGLLDGTLNLPFAPFHEQKNQYTGAVNIRKRKEYDKFSLSQLYPLSRFTEKLYSPEEYFRDAWTDNNKLGGTIFEALVSCHLYSRSLAFIVSL